MRQQKSLSDQVKVTMTELKLENEKVHFRLHMILLCGEKKCCRASIAVYISGVAESEISKTI